MTAAQSLKMSGASARALMQKANERTAVYFAVSISGLVVIIATMHLANGILMNSNLKSRGVVAENFVKKAR
jgi:hypothetical protein